MDEINKYPILSQTYQILLNLCRILSGYCGKEDPTVYLTIDIRFEVLILKNHFFKTPLKNKIDENKNQKINYSREDANALHVCGRCISFL